MKKIEKGPPGKFFSKVWDPLVLTVTSNADQKQIFNYHAPGKIKKNLFKKSLLKNLFKDQLTNLKNVFWCVPDFHLQNQRNKGQTSRHTQIPIRNYPLRSMRSTLGYQRHLLQ